MYEKMNMFTFPFIILLYNDFTSNVCKGLRLFNEFPRITWDK